MTDVIRDIHRKGVGVLLVEQKMSMAFKVAQQVLVMGHGEIVFCGSAAAMQANDDIRRQWLEVACASRARFRRVLPGRRAASS